LFNESIQGILEIVKTESCIVLLFTAELYGRIAR